MEEGYASCVSGEARYVMRKEREVVVSRDMEEGYASCVSVEARLGDEKEKGSVSLTRLRDKKRVCALCVNSHVVTSQGQLWREREKDVGVIKVT